MPQISRSCCLDALVTARVEQAPGAIAILDGKRSITYAELATLSNQLAHRLQCEGVKSGDIVGTYLHTSADLIVALLGILKTGAAYLPIDPANPAKRVRFMLEQAGAKILVTENNVPNDSGFSGTRVILSSCSESARQVNGRDYQAESLAYVVYTSGSTGVPKGVMVTHASVVSMLAALQGILCLKEADRFAALTSISFDPAVLEIFLSLAVGATICVVPRDAARDGRRLREELDKLDADVVQATPATWRLLLEAGWYSERTKILCGGDTLTPDLLDRLTERGSVAWNVYGPTEATVWATIKEMRRGGTPAIGKPLANAEVHVLAEDLSPVGEGVAGELYIGGEGVARGYVAQAALTAERFVPDPFKKGARLYKTGDLVKQNANGDLQFIERLDQQVKIRGVRIELGEIENVLVRVNGVSQAAVILDKSATQADVIHAYYVGYALPEAVRAALREWLPEHMLPSRLVRLNEMPLTHNRKIDRNSLSGSDITGETKDGEGVPAIILEIWKSILRVENIEMDDNFFEAGGHSLLAMRVASEIERKCGCPVPLTAIFEYPTIAGLSRYLVREENKTAELRGAGRNRGGARRQSYLER